MILCPDMFWSQRKTGDMRPIMNIWRGGSRGSDFNPSQQVLLQGGGAQLCFTPADAFPWWSSSDWTIGGTYGFWHRERMMSYSLHQCWQMPPCAHGRFANQSQSWGCLGSEGGSLHSTSCSVPMAAVMPLPWPQLFSVPFVCYSKTPNTIRYHRDAF